MNELDEKVALITGGASGIGRASAIRFAAAGGRVVLADVNEPAMASVVEEIGGDHAMAVLTDVTSEAQIEHLVQRTVERFGRIDVGLFCAGMGGVSPIQQHDSELFDRVIKLNLYGVFYSVKHVARQMVQQGSGGSLIAIASLNAHQVAEGFTAYCTSKAAVAMLMQSAALELGRYGIRANAIGPGLVETPLSAPLWQNEAIRDAFIAETPMGRYCQPEEVGDLALYLASDSSRFMTGQTLYLDGGQSLKKYPDMFSFIPPGTR